MQYRDMPNPSWELRECFHLHFLHHLSRRLQGRATAVKGGACLRFFHRSPRLSQDADWDILPQIGVKTLQNAVDSLLGSRSLLASLLPKGIVGLQVTKPKQTETTQRWKIALVLEAGPSLPTRIEFSRRQERIAYATGIPSPELLGRYGMTPFAAQFYDAPQMAAQKIRALASPSRYAVRDLFDLHHLFRVVSVRSEEIPDLPGMEEPLRKASEKVEGFTYSDFKEQVLPYLTETLMALYRDADEFEKLKEEVRETLNRIRP